jgi:hypothetical protein
MNGEKSLLADLVETIHRHRSRRKKQDSEAQSPCNRLGLLGRLIVPNIGTLLLVVVLILTQQAWAGPLLGTTTAPGPSATTVNYQGRLADSEGAPLSGTYGMSFTIYDASTDGDVVWGPENHVAVTVEDGLFSVGLGSLTAGGIPTTVWDGDRYLEIAVNGQAMSPRELIRSVPIAGMALSVPDSSITPEKIAPGAIAEINVLRRNDNISDQDDRVIVTGWGYVLGNGTKAVGEPLDFGLTFSEAPIVLINILGTSGTLPSSISDFSGFWDGGTVATAAPMDISTTGCLVNLARNADTFGTSSYYGYSWIAIGIVD